MNIKISEFAKTLGITTQAVYLMEKAGKVSVEKPDGKSKVVTEIKDEKIRVRYASKLQPQSA